MRDLAHQQSAKSVSVMAAQDVDLVEFTVIARHAAVMAPAPRETNQLMPVFFFDDKREVRDIACTENPLPLILTNGHCGSATVRFTEGLNVQCRQRRHVAWRRFTQLKRHLRLRPVQKDRPYSIAAIS